MTTLQQLSKRIDQTAKEIAVDSWRVKAGAVKEYLDNRDLTYDEAISMIEEFKQSADVISQPPKSFVDTIKQELINKLVNTDIV
ncbi:hypothetical protein [Rubellicoccus peritrichatus]|uniref:Uncharacterized protein n=1 Tax=Rubellicoccus peritrichatus TaxID=3080537 RepID=A0AAQ3L890_9BACT|nr:hypothetical protein [Puniceicoccus sp. CR14]WOO40399.1 hypothetical protein RZN69_17405 [Puniceicoccus sp. CR14]WOO40448.1 hypothetical protein RZN69_17650 [Puniceicoccus sp. CR14]WOO40497.1 hypothetical protein RZN69_17895 [Puniceicoccus sp. CR14]WOO40547.1 hypothetical protein RZN69_18145 [Puniceicoccus sp. CR14]